MLIFCNIFKCFYGILLLLCLCINIFNTAVSTRIMPSRLQRARCTIPEPSPHYIFATRRSNMILRVFCTIGYSLQGQRVLPCTNGKWYGQKPVCARSGCLKPGAPEDGEIIISHGYMATLFCADSHKLAGNRFSYCNGTHWDRPIGNCRERLNNIQHECDFETEDICGWVFEQTDNNDWKRVMAANVFTSFHTGPQHDHTTMSASGGHYMLMETYGNRPESIALTSPIYDRELSLKTACCFRFYYFMYGTGVGDLYVFVKPISISQREMLAKKGDYMKFNKTGNQNNIWNEAHFSIDEMHDNFQIVFIATGGKVHLSDIAIDDVKLMTGAECQALDKHEEESDESSEIEEKVTEVAYYDTQSCVSRCSQKSEQTVIPSWNGTKLILGLCSCHDECLEESNCCPDYRVVCLNELFSESTVMDMDTTANERADIFITTSTTPKAIVKKTTTAATTTSNTTTTTTTTRKPTTTTSTTTTTTRKPTTTTTTPKPTTTTTTTITTTPKPNTTTIATTTTTTPKTTSTTVAITPRTAPKTIKRITTTTTSSTTTTTTPKPTTTTPKPTTTTPKPTTTTSATTTTLTATTKSPEIIASTKSILVSKENDTWVWKPVAPDYRNSPQKDSNNSGITTMICVFLIMAISIVLIAFSYRYKIPISNFYKNHIGLIGGREDEASTSIVANFSQKKKRNGTSDETSVSTISIASSVDKKVEETKSKSKPTSKSKPSSSSYARERQNEENDTFSFYNDRDDMALL